MAQDCEHVVSGGFLFICADGDIPIDGTPAEAAEIAGYLTGGFFYE